MILDKYKKPVGRMPGAIELFLKINPDVPWWVCVCECGRWYSEMDHLAPYHLEASFCKRCGYRGNMECESV